MRSVYVKIFFTLCSNSKDGWVLGEVDCDWRFISLHFICYHHGMFNIKVIFHKQMFGTKVNFLTSWGPLSFSRRNLLHVVCYTGQKPFHTLVLSVPNLTIWFKTNSYITLCTVKKIICWPLYFKGHFVLTHPTHIQTAVPYSTISPGWLFLIVTLESAATS